MSGCWLIIIRSTVRGNFFFFTQGLSFFCDDIKLINVDLLELSSFRTDVAPPQLKQ